MEARKDAAGHHGEGLLVRCVWGASFSAWCKRSRVVPRRQKESGARRGAREAWVHEIGSTAEEDRFEWSRAAVHASPRKSGDALRASITHDSKPRMYRLLMRFASNRAAGLWERSTRWRGGRHAAQTLRGGGGAEEWGRGDKEETGRETYREVDDGLGRLVGVHAKYQRAVVQDVTVLLAPPQSLIEALGDLGAHRVSR